MIDFTTVQTYKVLPELETLNSANLSLIKENKYLKNILTTLIIGGLIYLVYQAYAPDNDVEQI